MVPPPAGRGKYTGRGNPLAKAMFQFRPLIRRSAIKMVVHSTAAVSYTQLDVYKRQQESLAPHLALCTVPGECGWCGYKGEIAITHAGDLISEHNDTECWVVCSACNQELENSRALHSASCTNPGVCMGCGYTGEMDISHIEMCIRDRPWAGMRRAPQPLCSDTWKTRFRECVFSRSGKQGGAPERHSPAIHPRKSWQECVP